MRSDNLKRHIQEKHEKKLKKCDCGKEMYTTNINRHQLTTCPLRRAIENDSVVSVCSNDSNKIEVVDEPETKINTNTNPTQSTSCPTWKSIENDDSVVPECSNVLNESEVVDEEEIQINTKMRIVKYRDGSMKYFCDPIKAGEFYFVLSQATLVDSTTTTQLPMPSPDSYIVYEVEEAEIDEVK